MSLYGQVLYVSDAPAGVVVGLETDIEAQARLIQAQDEVEVLENQRLPADEPWAEDTAAGVTFDDPGATAEGPAFASEGSADVEQHAPPKLGTGDLMPIPDDEAAEDLPLDPFLFAAAMQDDGAAEVPMLEPVESTEMEAASPSPFDEPGLVSASTDAEAPIEIPAPLDDLASDLEAPATVPAQAALPEAPEAGPSTDDVTSTLPILESDGYTVRFESPDAYKIQFDSNLKHGGLVVKAEPLSIGTQRMLALAVPGKEPYTVSARVVFHEPGKLGFMLDSLAIHKGRLASLGA